VANCLYGADINAMAVEMCKLSLWLVSLDPKLPFSFVDDKVLHGNSLLGLTDVRQLQYQHINPDAARGQMMLSDLDVDGVLARAVRLRKALASEVDDADPQRSATTKRRQWREYQALTAQLADVADGVVAAGLRAGGKPGRALTEAYENLQIAIGKAYPGKGAESNRSMLDDILETGLTPIVDTDYERWKPLHWVLAVPDVMENGGFDAVIGNPPFLGGKKVSGAAGSNVRDWLINALANGARGNADLVAYFFLRAAKLLMTRGNLGLIATNTVAQGDTREVGLDQIVAGGLTLTRAIQSRAWPVATVNLEYAAVWGSRGSVAPCVLRVADDLVVARISSLLEPAGRMDGSPSRLVQNIGLAYIGCYPLGMGFVLAPGQAAEWIETEAKYSDVVHPYLNGEDLNSRADTSPSRWIVDFNDQSEDTAKKYEVPYSHLLARVKGERARKPKAVRDAPWWLFFRSRPAMRLATAGLERVAVIAQVSKTLMPVFVPNRFVLDSKLVVFALDDHPSLAILSSSLHRLWAIKYGTTMRTDATYTPTTCFDTFPRPRPTEWLVDVGKTLDSERREIMLRRDLGLTKLYNLVNDPDIIDSADPDVARLRQIHVELDEAVMAAYGWDDVPLDGM